MGFVSDFKKFAMRGNVIDMAVGIIIGAAFGAIVSSLVADIVMPPIGVLLGEVDFSDLSVTIRKATDTNPAVVVGYGKFIQTIINFLIIALAVFMLVRFVNKLEKKSAEELAKPAAPTKDQELLTDILKQLKKK